MMACGFWRNARKTRAISLVQQSSAVPAEPRRFASVVETLWRQDPLDQPRSMKSEATFARSKLATDVDSATPLADGGPPLPAIIGPHVAQVHVHQPLQRS